MNSDMTGVEFVVLGLLAEAPRHGYELESTIAERGLREWTDIGFSSIYHGLKKLEAAGLLTADRAAAGKARKVYSITRQGRERLAREVRDALGVPEALHPRLLMGLANWPALSPGEAQAALAERQAALAAQRDRIVARRAAQRPLPDFVEALFDYALSLVEAEMAWLARTRETMDVADKYDVKKALKALYQPGGKQFEMIDVPEMTYVMVDGAGDPNRAPAYTEAVQWLYAVSYALKFACKAATGRDYTVPPLEGLWWADDPGDFVTRAKDRWRWTMMILVPDFVPPDLFAPALAKAGAKLGTPPASLRREALREGQCLQKLHIGSYDDEAPVLADLHDRLMPELGLAFNGRHHEIYLSDPRKVAPEKLKTILRQPVRPQ